MKPLLTLVCLLVTPFLFASEASLFRDEETGFAMHIPSSMERTWNLSHSQNEMEVIVFQNSEEEFPYQIIVFGKLPLTDVMGEGSEGLYPIIFDHVQEMLAEIAESQEDVSFEVLPALCDQEYGASRLRMTMPSEGMVLSFDIHSFLIDTYSIFLVTAMYGEDETDLTSFTYDLLSNCMIK